MFELDRAALAQRHRLEQYVFQLAHIARPVVVAELVQHLRGQLRQRAADLPAGRVEEVLDQRCQPVQALAQWRDMQAEHVEPMVEVLAEFALGAQLGQVDLGGADHPHVQVHLLVAADPAEAAVLQEAQQLGLQPRAHFADAVEEQGAAGGQLQQAELALRARALEGAGAVAEQLGLGHGFRQSRTIQRHEWRLPARAGQVAGARQQFLAGAGLALDQQRRIQRRHAPRLAHHRGHHPGTLEDAVEAAQFLLAHMVDAFADAVGAVQGEYRAGQGIALVMFGLQRSDVGEEHIALDLDPQAVDSRLVGAHQFRQVEILGVTRQRNPRHLVHAHAEQLRGGAIGRHYRTAHVDRQHREFQGAEQGVQLQMPAFAGHQADALDPEHPGDRLQLGPQGLELQVDQVRAEHVDGVALFAADLATGDVDAVVDQQVEDVAQNTDPVLTVNLDTHGRPRAHFLVGRASKIDEPD